MIVVITLAEIIAIVLFIGIIMVWTYFTVTNSYKQFVCTHDGGVNETRSCDAICKLCGKNLGFIGNEENKKRRTQ